jgi:phosphatidylserine/phosphatidylglycerophosphate/cardiolipin synthase-like enzyme
MSINLKVYDNGDHTCLVWMPADGKPIAECRGFTIRRILDGTESYLPGFAGFSDGEKLDPAALWKRPLQRYMWWDYHVKPGQVVRYSIIPVVRPTAGGDLQLSTADATALTPPMTVTGQTSPHISAYFNKGVVAAQWVSRVLLDIAAKQKVKQPKLLELIGNLKEPTATEPGNALRNALSGLLRPQLLKLLADVKQNGGEIYAALYELNDPELIAGLKALGKKCHLLLANGAFAKKPHNDENYAVRQELKDVVDMHDRLVGGNHFAHNKFVVFCDASGKPTSVLSGSTNWAMTGLCTQANNAVIVDSPELAADFLNQWNLLKAAGNDYPPSLAQANSKSNTFSVDGASITQWFAPTAGGEDLIYARKLINEAKNGILFLFFNPGKFVEPGEPGASDADWTLLQNIITRHHEDSPNYNANLYISGVVNQAIENLTGGGPAKSKSKAQEAAADPTAPAPVTLFSAGNAPPQRLGYESMIPKNIKEVFHDWQAETLGSGVHIHSKVVVIDPFGEKPVVMTGSHNLGHKASIANDDNLMIIEGNAAIAASYAVNIIAIYQNFRFNAYAEEHRNDPHVFHNLQDNGDWQAGHLSGGALAELLFWLGKPGAAPSGAPAPGDAPAPGGPPAKTVTAGPAPTPPRGKPAQKPKAPKKTTKKKPPKKKTPKKKAPAKKEKAAKKKKKTPAKKKKSAKKKRAA